MTKKVQRALEREQAVAAAEEAEKIRLQLIKNIQEEIRLERYNTEQEVLLEESQTVMRKIQLEKTRSVVHENKKAFMDHVLATEEKENWIMYLTCDDLPDAAKLSDMNTFMFLWSLEEDKDINMEKVIRKCKIVQYLLSKLHEIINFSLTRSADYIEECKMIRQDFRNKLQNCIDQACYRLLRQIERDMLRVDLRNAIYVKESSYLVYCIWVLIKLPISIKDIPDKDRKPIEVHFKEIELTIKMPLDIDCYCMAIRGLWLDYDHYSDIGTSYVMPEIPEKYQMNMDLLTFCSNEYETKRKIREEQLEGRRLRLEEKKAMLRKMENPVPAVTIKSDRRGRKGGGQYGRTKRPESEQETEPLPYLPTPNEIILLKEEEIRKEVRKQLFTKCEKTEINLRKYKILGGIYHIDLVYQPPQPKDMRRNIFLTTLQIPKELKHVPFYKPYKAPPPAPASERTPEIIENEMRALETAMEALALVTLKLPDTVLWFEPPLVAHWIPEKKIWSTQDVHDIKFNEEKQQITFRTGRFGIHGLAANKLINLPFQSWEVKPEMGRNSQGGVVLNLTAATVQAEFLVREDMVCLNSLIGGTSPALQNIVGEYMKLQFLIDKMREGGCDLFPERDTASYVKGLPMKHLVTERHLQECIGLLCTAYTFSWSRWNVTRTSREIVLQFKELHGCVAKQRTNLTLLVTPSQTMIVQCTEVSSEFSNVPIDGENTKFYADLYHLALHNAGIKSRLLIKDISFKLALTVTRLLESTSVISMSS
ncbi:dynein axonemal intermediate chain 7 homolog isoform X2 [Polistes fuscatus]|uniref:dynein axonemal intermediate chain 7 homolog isoform X2 n=1 Tax=Polistes fuscatus TaxID=30207 RepID=UPI001CA9EFDE|nr:dynein axonemal intermediate chain 7 homolog isoform X2 [Polistes fuscatus]XP_043500205.1 dynein axonemal intermediate chain 7 homolog isoform X2 [Polistes fuscatus]